MTKRAVSVLTVTLGALMLAACTWTAERPATAELPTPVEDARAAADAHLRTSTNAVCFSSQESNWPAEAFEFDDELRAMPTSEGWVEPQRAWLGSLPSAAAAFGGVVVARDAGSAWIRRAVRPDDGFRDVAVGAPMVEELRAIRTSDGRTVWFGAENWVAAVPCGSG